MRQLLLALLVPLLLLSTPRAEAKPPPLPAQVTAAPDPATAPAVPPGAVLSTTAAPSTAPDPQPLCLPPTNARWMQWAEYLTVSVFATLATGYEASQHFPR